MLSFFCSADHSQVSGGGGTGTGGPQPPRHMHPYPQPLLRCVQDALYSHLMTVKAFFLQTLAVLTPAELGVTKE